MPIVSAVLEYMVERGSGAGSLFTWENGKYLTRASFVKVVRTALTVASRSFRIGVAMTASTCRIQDSLIKTLGRWESSVHTVLSHKSCVG